MSNVYFYFCARCANYVTNDEIEDMPIEQETAMFSGIARIRAAYYLTHTSAVDREMSFKCECCGTRCFGDRHAYAYAAKPAQEQTK